MPGRESQGSSPLILFLILGLIGVFIWQTYIVLEMGNTGNEMIRNYALDGQVLEGQYYRVFTSMFLHAGALHLVSNLAVFYIVGRPLERRIGSLRFLFLYLFSGVLGALGGLLMLSEGEIAVGASGAIMGVLAAATFLVPTDSMLEELPVLRMFSVPVIRSMFSIVLLGSLFIFQETLMAFFEFYEVVDTQIGHSAHFGGILGGTLLSYFWKPDETLQSAKFIFPIVILALGLLTLPKFTDLWFGVGGLLVLLLIYFKRKRTGGVLRY